MEKYPSDELKKFITRMPVVLHDDLSKAAQSNRRSMNAELIARLTQSFAGNSSVGSNSTGAAVDQNNFHHELASYVARCVCDDWTTDEKAEKAAEAYLKVLSRLGKKATSDAPDR